MSLFTWNASLSVGIPVIDEQHQRLVALINRLFDAMVSGKGRQTLGEVLDGLVEYTASHFADEERLMQVHLYPGYESHRAKHLELTQQVHELRDRFAAGKPAITMEVMTFLKDWLAEHIQQTDKALGRYLVANS